MLVRRLTAAVTGSLLLSSMAFELLHAQSGDTAAIDAVLRQAVDRGDVPGVVAVATDRNGTFYSGAFGTADAAAGRAMTTDAVFRIASMTKPITSTALMQLVEQHKVDLDAPASRYLKAFEQPQVLASFDASTGAYTVKPARAPVTVRQLMTHTSGLGYGFTSATTRDFKPKAGDTFAVGPLMFEPGTQWLYGTSTDWIGRLVEAVSGESLEDYFKARITGPLGMTETAFNLPSALQPRLVNNWQRDPNGRLGERPRATSNPVTQFNGGGGLSSTALDYIKFVRMMLNDGEYRATSTRIVAATTVGEMSRNQIGALSARALKTALPAQSADFSFIADGRDKWGLGFLISMAPGQGLRSPGSLSWGGINNTYFWIDRTKGVGGVVMMQFLPFADARALAVYEAFEREVYRARR